MRGGGKIDLKKVSGSLESIQQTLVERFLQLTGYPDEELISLRLHPRGQIKPTAAKAQA
jgi:hypothetical protein